MRVTVDQIGELMDLIRDHVVTTGHRSFYSSNYPTRALMGFGCNVCDTLDSMDFEVLVPHLVIVRTPLMNGPDRGLDALLTWIAEIPSPHDHYREPCANAWQHLLADDEPV